MPEVRLENVTRRHRGPGGVEKLALRGLSLAVQHGELLVVLGPSGSGKTTTLRLVAGLDPTDAGVIWIDGRDVAGVPPHERGVAMVFQDHPLLPHLSVQENLGFAVRFLPLTKDDRTRRLGEVAEWLDLGPLMGRAPGGLSGGERQRVALGAALVARPRLLLLDEPLAHVDAQQRARLRFDLRRLQRDLGLTVIHVTHDQSEAMALADRLAVLRAGELEQVGVPLEVYRRPASMFVAGFLGSPGMNLLEGRWSAGGCSGGGVFMPNRGGEVCLPGPKVSGIPGDGVRVLGLRPEALRLGDSGGLGFRGKVDLVEPGGGGALVGIALGGSRVHVRVTGNWLPGIGDAVEVGFEPGDVHWFDPGTGRRLDD